MAGPYLHRVGSSGRGSSEEGDAPGSQGFPDVPRDKLDVDALCKVGDEVGITVDECGVVDGAEIVFVEGPRLVGDALAGRLPSSVPHAGDDVP